MAKIQLDLHLISALRKKFDELGFLSLQKMAAFQFPADKRGSKREDNAFNCLCAALDKIEDLVEHLNSLDLSQTKEGTFALCDFFNYGQTLIDCISMFARIYDIKYPSVNDTSSFHQKGEEGTGTDEKYFKYLRSLCSAHPLSTTAYPEYQGESPEWCPYINFAKSTSARMLKLTYPELKEADYIAVVYRNNTDDKYIPIMIPQLFHYLNKRYLFINKIIQAIDNHYNCIKIDELKNRHILLSEECASYDMYLKNLEKEVSDRCNASPHTVRTWRAIFRTHFFDEKNENLLEEYKKELKRYISHIHNDLQNMDCLRDSWSLVIFPTETFPDLKDYSYEDLKLLSLFPSNAVEDLTQEDFSFIDSPLEVDKKWVHAMLAVFDEELSQGADHQKLVAVARGIENFRATSSSEWARIQLKIMEPVLQKHICFDYTLNNWHLFLQTKLAKWLLGKHNGRN